MTTHRLRRSRLVHGLSTSFLAVVASIWAGSLVVSGLLLLTQGVSEWFSTETGFQPAAWRSMGVALVTGGQFIFMFMVADRVFPWAARRRWVWAVELAVVGIGLGACVVALVLA
ncbi:MAG: hypothetical protein AAGF47_01405 [Planctomycetota bacterium]